MKIYNEVRIDIATGKTIYEDFCEYDGEIAECRSGGGSVKYMQSPEQRQVFQLLMPLVEMMTGVGMEGKSPWQIPSTEGMMPSKGWYEGMDPNIMAGVREPYIDASKQLTESLGYSAGSPRGGPSGMLGDVQSDFWSKAGTQMGKTAWDIVSPVQQMGWQAKLQGSQFPWTAMPSMMGGTYSQPVVSQPSTMGSDLMSMLGMLGGSYLMGPGFAAGK